MKLRRIGAYKSNFNQQIETINTGTVDALGGSFDIRNNKTIYITAKKLTGTILAAVLTVQVSPDDDTWFDTADTLTFTDENPVNKCDIIGSSCFVRFKVTTKSTIASTATVIIQAK